MTLVKYGKSSNALIDLKRSFFTENDKHVKEQKEISKLYIQQPERIKCKNCDKHLGDKPDFIKDNIGYKICKNCTHLNGVYEDTVEFCKRVYTHEDGKNYAENYKSETLHDFQKRVMNIYVPKAEFLYNSIQDDPPPNSCVI